MNLYIINSVNGNKYTMDDESKYLQTLEDNKFPTPSNCHIVEDSSILKSYAVSSSNGSTPTSSSTPTLSQLTTIGCHMEMEDVGSTGTTIIKNEESYVLPPFMH